MRQLIAIFILLVVVTLALILTTVTTRAEIIKTKPVKTEEIIPHLESYSLGGLLEKADGGDAQVKSFLMGLWSGVLWTNLYVELVQAQPPVYCLPKDKVYDDKTVMALLKKSLINCEECNKDTPGLGMIVILLKEFPCEDKKVDGYMTTEEPPIPIKKGG